MINFRLIKRAVINLNERKQLIFPIERGNIQVKIDKNYSYKQKKVKTNALKI
jgi:hypothetical protein